MKSIIFTLLLFIGVLLRSQSYTAPIPQDMGCLILDHNSTYQSDVLIENGECIESAENGAGLITTFNGDLIATSGDYIRIGGETIMKNLDNSSKIQLRIDENLSNADLAWYYPVSEPGTVGIYEKMEIGIKLDDLLEERVQNFVNDVTGTFQINPFDPDQIEIKAEIYKGGSLISTKYAFYYDEFERDLSNSDLSQNTWIKDTTSYHFRVRYAPKSTGLHQCNISLRLNGATWQNLGNFSFDVINSSNKGFVALGSSKRFLTYPNGETFFPVGQNLLWPRLAGSSFGERNNPNTWSPNAFLQFQSKVSQLYNNGANCFRMLIHQKSFEIEHEKMNNYSGRMNNAWELDRLLDLIHQFPNFKVYLDLQLQFVYGDGNAYGLNNMDFVGGNHPVYNTANCSYNPNDIGHCYHAELGIQNSRDVFGNSTAQEMYKRRIKYYMSRYAYSTDILAFELLSESNGTGEQYEVVPDNSPNAPFACKIQAGLKPYASNYNNYRLDVYNWHMMLANYIKNDLGENCHPLAVNYVLPDMNDIFGTSDASYAISNVDIFSNNFYSGNLEKWEDDFEKYDDFRTSLQSSVASNYDKALFHSEDGYRGSLTDLTLPRACDINHTQFYKCLWHGGFTGGLGVPFDWFEFDNPSLWSNYQIYTNFIEGINFNDGWCPIFESFYDLKVNGVKNNLGELNALAKIDGVNTRVIGVMSNRTWNYFTDGDDDCAVSTQNIQDAYHDSPKFIPDYGKGKLYLNDLPSKMDFVIEFYNPFDGQFLFSTIKKSKNNGKLRIEFNGLYGSPLASASTSMKAFKIYPLGQNFKSDSAELINLEQLLVHKENLNNVGDEKEHDIMKDLVQLYPNPSIDGIFNISGLNSKSIIKLFTLEGKEIESVIINNGRLDLSAHSTGIYIVKVEQNGEIYTFKCIYLEP